MSNKEQVKTRKERVFRITASDLGQLTQGYYEGVHDTIRGYTGQMKKLETRIQNQRQQLREYGEKLEAMKTFRGIVRTIGQKLGVCR